MGDIHVHTAPHGYEEEGYLVWYWGDVAFTLIYAGLAVAELYVVHFSTQRRKEVPWRESGGGMDWWRKKFLFLCMLLPLTVLRSWNLWLWAEFNGEAGEDVGDPDRINSLKSQGDWLNAIAFWYLLALKSLFLLTWHEITRSGGLLRWRTVYFRLAGAIAALAIFVGVPQALAVQYGNICDSSRHNDYCRKYLDATSALVVLQAIIGVGFGFAFGSYVWNLQANDLVGYEALPSQSLLNQAGNRDSYGSTDGNLSDQETGLSRDIHHKFRLQQAKMYDGTAHCVSFSLIAHCAFNVYFAWYASGGLGLIGNSSLMVLTILKLIAVEMAPLAWFCITIYADFASVERVTVEASMLEEMGNHDAGEQRRESGKQAREHDAPAPPEAYQIE
ncbi:hypothetical protein GUITHDRAFT_166693 [Guillardia theta CCMP2712]|uniref:Uncharacterized protein n=1 Tax=Guillardia theta (strain CCMP2712) TaxID=905079 RepID=L1I9B4_GUITC|nr:hypothetical protein GUITHDRAFT_166693 [Guillardia theta CCMP2712]EKX32499.1 hypothetical protein GUITHDRAFT_166693 [Guillardia theta CCMP2712]|mmetsp:Transcript_29462/g.94499  ORF Transcript_29462/g.94499 Transcript_29462/m.94499 type:complete len:388 (-) Transcript_29462:80-1243(-)|eukprot:XP_005819479.1 hypothetical protein GUITHDRAFT_166693 [Guillardia theta CCMP2712]